MLVCHEHIVAAMSGKQSKSSRVQMKPGWRRLLQRNLLFCPNARWLRSTDDLDANAVRTQERYNRPDSQVSTKEESGRFGAVEMGMELESRNGVRLVANLPFFNGSDSVNANKSVGGLEQD